ncbi:serine protease, partial [Cylindrospermopsis raciborskii]|uniref:serine protease n=2 Tax=Cylindrospermopsis raciborskii TaxID=77022 RepID=UPI001587A849
MKHYITIIFCLFLLAPSENTLANPITKNLTAKTNSCEIRPEDQENAQYSDLQQQEIARRITVRIIANNNIGSGTILSRNNNSYLVATNSHVLLEANSDNISIQTVSGKTYTGKIIPQTNLKKLDLSILEFYSAEYYCSAPEIVDTTINLEMPIMAAGYTKGKIIFRKGNVQRIAEPSLKEGYGIGYSVNIIPGMSGGPIINSRGYLIGINGKRPYPILNSGYIDINGKQPSAAEIQEFRKLSWGIPVTTLLSQVRTDLLQKYSLPLPNIATKVAVQPLPPWIAKIEEKVKQFTVRIDNRDGENGSGVIIAKEGSTYTILTAAHVLCEKASNNRCIEQEYSILTGDDKKHPIDRNSIKKEEGVDLAVVKFTSSENYPIATLADYPTQDNQYIFTAGYPKLGENRSPWRFTLGQTFSKEQGLLATRSSDFKSSGSGLQAISVSLTEGYELVYTNITLGGMSGGPVLDTEGRVIGIHGRADGQVAIDEKTGDIGPNNGQVQLGYSLGIPIRTFLGIAPRLNSQAQQIEKTTARELQSGKIDSIKQVLLSVDISKGSTTASNWLERGNQLLRLGRPREAITAFDNAIQQKPAFIHLAYYGKGAGLALLSLALFDSGKVEEAAIALEQAIKAKSDFVPAWDYLSLAHGRLGKFNEALVAINQAIKLQPDNSNLYNTKWQVLSSLKRYQEAIDAIDQAIKLSPRVAFYNNRGVARFQSGDKQGAIADYNQAITLDPKFALAYNNRGLARFQSGDKEGAIADYNQAITLNPKNALAYINRGLARFQSGDKEGAIADYNQAITLDPKNALAYIGRGFARFQSGDKQGAIADFNQAITLDPKNALAYIGRGFARFQSGDKQGAIA